MSPFDKCRSYTNGYFIRKAVAKCEEEGKGVGPGGCYHIVSTGGKLPYSEKDIKHSEIFREKIVGDFRSE